MERPKGFTARIEANGYTADAPWTYGTRKWSVTVVNTRTGKSVSFQYHTGPAIRETPTMLDVVQALITDGRFYEDNPTLSEFARECGYEFIPNVPLHHQDPELVKSYLTCKRHAEGMHRVFGADLDAMAEWSADS